jgi:hypothetical protein
MNEKALGFSFFIVPRIPHVSPEHISTVHINRTGSNKLSSALDTKAINAKKSQYAMKHPMLIFPNFAFIFCTPVNPANPVKNHSTLASTSAVLHGR